MKNIEYFVEKLNIIYEDNHLLVVEKPINVLSQKDATGDIDMNDILKLYLKQKYQKPGNVYLGLIHRLDRRVGGVMVFAKTSKAAKRLSEAMRNNEIKKTYLACVKGKLEKDGTIKVNIKKENNVAIISKDGKEAILNYHVINYYQDCTYVFVDLITGRYNQIRASFAHINHPLINDYKYDQAIKPTNADLGLWCYKITLTHPVTKITQTFTLQPQGAIWEGLKKSNHFK